MRISYKPTPPCGLYLLPYYFKIIFHQCGEHREFTQYSSSIVTTPAEIIIFLNFLSEKSSVEFPKKI